MIQYMKQYLDYAHHAFRLHLAIRMADIKQKAYNRQYFVMPIEISNGKGKLVSVSRKEAVKLRRMKWLCPVLKKVDSCFVLIVSFFFHDLRHF
ncbi:hypothetical protein [Tannerella forsythia]|uniref:hypothetical protein n=1 Tax=Tannerella forsythia TaxID=28112 RepID=UPI000B2378DC|nr:hypothetical protein [Tannerella forsythia]